MERSGIVHQAAQIPVSPAGVPPQCIPEDLDIHAAPAAYHIADGALQVINRHRISKWVFVCDRPRPCSSALMRYTFTPSPFKRCGLYPLFTVTV